MLRRWLRKWLGIFDAPVQKPSPEWLRVKMEYDPVARSVTWTAPLGYVPVPYLKNGILGVSLVKSQWEGVDCFWGTTAPVGSAKAVLEPLIVQSIESPKY